jgi:hypothetical protein
MKFIIQGLPERYRIRSGIASSNRMIPRWEGSGSFGGFEAGNIGRYDSIRKDAESAVILSVAKNLVLSDRRQILHFVQSLP